MKLPLDNHNLLLYESQFLLQRNNLLAKKRSGFLIDWSHVT
jgi:hypothetical protein